MNRVLEIDAGNQMAWVEAGVTLSEFETAVDEAGFYFPPHPGEESAMIGGMIATNAGGSRAVKYGVIRNYVRGLEVVTPAGDILDLGGKLIKSSTGYNLLQLMIGSEGTLGVITKAVIQFLAKPAATRSLVIPFDDARGGHRHRPRSSSSAIVPLALEFVPLDVIRISEEHLHRNWPCAAGETHLFVILDAASDEEMDRASQTVAEIALAAGALDVFIADTPAKQDNVLAIRSKIYEAIKARHDRDPRRLRPAGRDRRPRQEGPRARGAPTASGCPTFGHAGDGNVHTHIMKARREDGRIVPLPEAEWRAALDAVRDGDLRRRCGPGRRHLRGARHRPGQKALPGDCLSPEQIDLMRGIKNVFDPRGILNPGKIFDL